MTSKQLYNKLYDLNSVRDNKFCYTEEYRLQDRNMSNTVQENGFLWKHQKLCTNNEGQKFDSSK